MKTDKIKLLYCHYGWAVKEIADATHYPTSYVQQVVNENNWEPGTGLVIARGAEEGENKDPTDVSIDYLKSRDIEKQVALAPIYAIAEMTLLEKLMEVADNLEPNDPSAHTALVNITKAYKSLTQGSVVSQIMDDGKGALGNTGIQLNVITQIA